MSATVTAQHGALIRSADGTERIYQGRTVAEAFGAGRLADLRLLCGQAKGGRILTPGMDIEGAPDGYSWIALRAYELVILLNAAEMLDGHLEAAAKAKSTR